MIDCPTDKQCEHKCQLCGEHPTSRIIKNKINGNVLHICDNCVKFVLGQRCDG